MSLPQSRGAYLHYYQIWDRAIADPSGIRVRCESYDNAIYHRIRLHKARSILRDESRDLYEADHPQYNISPYDHYLCMIRPAPGDNADHYLIISPRTIGILGEIESLSGTEYEPQWQLEHEQTPQLSPPTGTKLLPPRLESTSDAPSDRSSSKSSMTPESPPLIPGLRRL